MGTPKIFGQKKYINATALRPVTDPNEIQFHLLETMMVWKILERGPVSLLWYYLHSVHSSLAISLLDQARSLVRMQMQMQMVLQTERPRLTPNKPTLLQGTHSGPICLTSSVASSNIWRHKRRSRRVSMPGTLRHLSRAGTLLRLRKCKLTVAGIMMLNV